MSPNSGPTCGAAVETGAVFCTGCGIRLPEHASEAARSASSAETKPTPPTKLCPACKAMIEPEAAFCNGCGTRMAKACVNESAPAAAVTSVPTPAAGKPTVAPVQPRRASSSSRALAGPAMAAQPAYATSSQPKPQPELGGSSSTHKLGPIVIVVLLLVILGAAALLWLRPSTTPSSSGSKVLILTPQPSSLTVEPNSTTSLSVAVQGDGGAGVTWKIAENYGGSIAPAGVTLQGSRIIYKATYSSGGTPGDYHVVATSAANKDVRVCIPVRVER